MAISKAQAMRPALKDVIDTLDSVTNAIGSITQTVDLITDIQVTPEMFGAIGDGISDDTEAWQSAIDSGYKIVAGSERYRCRTIRVAHNCEIDCNGASFICDSNILFDCYGAITTTLANEENYSPNQPNYYISNEQYANYSGFAFVKGENNFITSRPYYRGGFVCNFSNGVLVDRFPIPVTGVSIDLITPITVAIYNIADIRYGIEITTASRLIRVTYGLNCTLKNISLTEDAYTSIDFEMCYNCKIYNLNYRKRDSIFTNDNYLVAFNSSNYCSVCDSYLYNYNWHCVTTGSTYLSFHNSVMNSVLLSDTGIAYCDHDNGIGTIIDGCVCSNIVVSALCNLNNVTIFSINNTFYSCLLRISPCNIREIAIYNLSNITFLADTSVSNTSYYGMWCSKSVQQQGGTYYITQLNITNMHGYYDTNVAKHPFIRLNMGTTDTYVIEKINIVNSSVHILPVANAYLSLHDTTNFVIKITNCSDVRIGNTGYTANVIKVTNSEIALGFGDCYELYVTNSKIPFNLVGNIISVFMGNDIYITAGLVQNTVAMLSDCAKVSLSNLNDASKSVSIISFVKNESNVIYYTYLDSTGAIVAAQY